MMLDLSYRDQTSAVLGLLNEKYREEITLQLIKEDEERQKRGNKSTKNESKAKEDKNLEDSSVEIEEYDEVYWQSFEFYKYYFEDENVLESLVVVPSAECKKQKKRKKKIATVNTRHTSDAASNDYPAICSDQKNNIADTIEDVEIIPVQTKSEVENKQEVPEEKQAKPKPDVKKKNPIQETSKPATSENKQKAEKNRAKENATKKKKKRANRASRLADKKAIIEYEEVKEKALQFFSHLTDSRITPKQNPKAKKKPHTKPKKPPNEEPPHKVDDERDKEMEKGDSKACSVETHDEEVNAEEDFAEKEYVEEYVEEEYDEQECDVEFNGEGWEEYCGNEGLPESYGEAILSPYVKSPSESEFFDRLNQDIGTFAAAMEEHNRRLRAVTGEVQQAVSSLVLKLFHGTFLS
eukprot:TRINITY_DN1773_c0_g4_i3.p1 TRINITY_DN1773_c0_g4~~TRINITY_DN1773_c0_g4_i3.p1  ORF type:complete len:409 (-),score=136.26 TRINITY_DN1773_c0_g4_i3:974-2200(-)